MFYSKKDFRPTDEQLSWALSLQKQLPIKYLKEVIGFCEINTVKLDNWTVVQDNVKVKAYFGVDGGVEIELDYLPDKVKAVVIILSAYKEFILKEKYGYILN